uniref:Uncharacterized protein n=1 Tax=Pyramimonas orientalis virus TaxID=455367 RepID=A0A7M3UNT9_POV01|nr:hypothetical protein HWQ62_00237 [Pyramimonas orientalis virus]
MSILGGLTTDYASDTGTFIISSMITKGVYAINDINEAYNPMDLQLGTNGAINLIVGSGNNVSDRPENCLSIIDLYREQTGVYNFAVNGSNAIAFSPNDENTTVYIGDAVIYSDTDYVYLTSYTKKLAFDSGEISLGGSLHTSQDAKIEGELYTGEVNITLAITEFDLLGYAFRINAVNHNLELIKYLSAELEENNSAQLVATFGHGTLSNDPNYSFNTFTSTGGSTPPSNNGNNNSNTSNTGSSGSSRSYWNTNGNDIFFGMDGGTSQYVGIHTSTPSVELDVIGTVKATQFTDGDLSISNGFIFNAKTIEVNSEGQFGGIHFKNLKGPGQGHYWNGSASNIYEIDLLPLSTYSNDLTLDDFYSGTSITWFDNTPSNILLSSFCNDLVALGGDVSFSNLIMDSLVGNTMTTSMFTTCNMIAEEATVSNIITSNIQSSNINITNELIVSTINTSYVDVATSIVVGETVTASNVQTNDLTVASNITTNDLTLLGTLNASAITALINKMVADEVNTRVASITETLSANKLAVSNVVTDLVPDVDVTYDLGTSNNRWRDLYLSGNTMYFDDIVLDVVEVNGKKRLNIVGGALAMESIAFQDGTTMASTNEIVYSMNEGELFGDFSSFTMVVNTTRSTVELFSGTYVYNNKHNIATMGNTWNVVDFEHNDILPINTDGSGVDMNRGYLVKSGGLPRDVQVSFIKRNKFVGQNVFFTHESKSNINELFPVRNFDPFSKYFKNKCKADFHYFYNIREVEEGYLCPCVSIYFEVGNENQNFVQINSIDDFNNKIGGNKFYDIEFIYFYKAPLYEIKYIVDNMTNKYLISNDANARLNKAYVYDTDTSTYILETINEDYGLYPRITIKKWDNSINNTEFSEVIYKESMGWGIGGADNGPDLPTVFQKFKTNGWLLELFKVTFKYIKYGYVFGEFTQFDFNVNLVFDQLTADDIVFVDENHLETTDGSIIENNTIICFKKQIFVGLI